MKPLPPKKIRKRLVEATGFGKPSGYSDQASLVCIALSLQSSVFSRQFLGVLAIFLLHDGQRVAGRAGVGSGQQE